MLRKEELETILIDAVKRGEDKYGEPRVNKDDIEELVEMMGGDRNDFYEVMKMAFEVLINGEKMPEKKRS